MIILKNVDDFFAIRHSHDIQEIIKPLNRLKINFFNHIKIYNDGSRISLSNRGDWLEHFFYNKYYNVGVFSKNYDRLVTNQYLWDSLQNNMVFSIANEGFNIMHGTTFVRKNPAYVDMYHFATTRDNFSIKNLYVNHPDIFQHFIDYYTSKSFSLQKQCKPDFIIGSNETESTPYQDELSCFNNNDIEGYFNETKLNKYVVNYKNKNYILSKRQFQCLNAIIESSSIKEAAYMLGIKQRTLYFYLTNIKNKFSCNTTSQLYKIAKKIQYK